MLKPTQILCKTWSSTIRLPKSKFPPSPSSSSTAEYLRRCSDQLYAWQQSTRSKLEDDDNASKTFTLHDGPPYANGPLHIGHALNKITKDIICRYQVGQGKRVNYVPGWDCHGLPIEIKALEAQQKSERKGAVMDPVSIRKAARALATRTIEEQKKGFKEWAVMGDWDNAYQTMNADFEIRQLEVFKDMFDWALIYRQFKPVYWSPSSRTALAEAELEYDENYTSLSAFVRFPAYPLENEGALAGIEEPLNVVIWTTTPWTLPANRAIAVHDDMEYCLVKDSDKDELTLIASTRLEHYKSILGRDVTPVEGIRLRGSDLAGYLEYENPFQKWHWTQPIIHADFVTDSSGTGLVHLAPGHGMEDYEVCKAHGIEAVAPIDDSGAYTRDAFPKQPDLLQGLKVLEKGESSGSAAVLKYLQQQDLIRATHTIRHKYPIDWRTKKPVVVRATEQWFADVRGLAGSALAAMDSVRFMPEAGRARLKSFINGRSEWCISRQRAWGVPIPALYRIDGGRYEANMDSWIIEHIIDVVKERGTDAWWTDPQDDPAWIPARLQGDGSYVRGRDTMDVWFDSGTSWTLLPPKEGRPVADVYLEGTDQHRGWFQSSLLTHLAMQLGSKAQPPFKTLITHGFTLDSEGRKMSKSLGNVIAPNQIISGELLPKAKGKKQSSLGADALRLWVASSDYTRDVTIGQQGLLSVNQALTKYRITFKWLLGVLSLESCSPAFSSFNAVRTDLSENASTTKYLADKLAAHRLAQISQEVKEYYDEYKFFKGVNTINKYIANDLSAFYFETLKDRIYTGAKEDCMQVQNIVAVIFYDLLQMLAPVCPLLVEEVWDHVPQTLRDGSEHPARAVWEPIQFSIPVRTPQHELQQFAASKEIGSGEKEHQPALATSAAEPSPSEARDDGGNASDVLASTSKLTHREESGRLQWYAEYIAAIGTAIKAAQENLRSEKLMGSSVECDATLIPLSTSDSRLLELLSSTTPEDLAGIFVVSSFQTLPNLEAKQSLTGPGKVQGKDGIWSSEVLFETPGGCQAKVVVSKPKGEKCGRCWRFVAEEEGALCGRCESVVRAEYPTLDV